MIFPQMPGSKRETTGSARRSAVAPRFISFLLAALSGCAHIGGPGQWREEVVLPDGRTIEITRDVLTGSRYDQVPESWKSGPPLKGHVLRIPIPGTREVAVWDHDAGLTPMAIHFSDGVLFLVTEPWKCEHYDQYGRPVPPYVVFRYGGGKWKRIAFEELPPQLTQANLLSVQHSSKVQKDYYSARDIKAINNPFTSTIHRAGIKGFELCASRLNARDEAKTKGDKDAD